ncbi:MAG: DUF1499 domain-containing protein [Sphingomonadales bacterium]|nr:DUF1499 domain-containing protein [Sphingomonadales bacterium]
MAEGTTVASKRGWQIVAPLGFGAGLIALFTLIVAGPGHAAGLWHYSVSFILMRYAFFLGAAGGIVALLGVIITWRGDRKRRTMAVIGLVAGIATVLAIYSWRAKARSLPFIHDITTSVDDPPAFTVIPPRVYTERELGILPPPEKQKEMIRDAYGDLETLLVDTDVAETTALAAEAARELGWEIAANDPAAGRLEATDTTFWFGFKDDIVVRIRAAEGGSAVDVRSVSRVGISDIGKNAERIRSFIATFQNAKIRADAAAKRASQ